MWVLEELELPIVSISSEANRKKVLMKSPWEIIKKPVGSGGIFSLLSSNKILDSLNEMGVQYIQVRSSAGHLTVLIIHPDNFGPLSFILTLCSVAWYYLKRLYFSIADMQLIQQANHWASSAIWRCRFPWC